MSTFSAKTCSKKIDARQSIALKIGGIFSFNLFSMAKKVYNFTQKKLPKIGGIFNFNLFSMAKKVYKYEIDKNLPSEKILM